MIIIGVNVVERYSRTTQATGGSRLRGRNTMLGKRCHPHEIAKSEDGKTWHPKVSILNRSCRI